MLEGAGQPVCIAGGAEVLAMEQYPLQRALVLLSAVLTKRQLRLHVFVQLRQRGIIKPFARKRSMTAYCTHANGEAHLAADRFNQ